MARRAEIEVGRRISALRSGLRTADEYFEALEAAVPVSAPELIEQIRDARADVAQALAREARMQERHLAAIPQPEHERKTS